MRGQFHVRTSGRPDVRSRATVAPCCRRVPATATFIPTKPRWSPRRGFPRPCARWETANHNHLGTGLPSKLSTNGSNCPHRRIFPSTGRGCECKPVVAASGGTSATCSERKRNDDSTEVIHQSQFCAFEYHNFAPCVGAFLRALW